ncbi:EXPERA domain-containing protein, partial [Streptomyces sp. NPDC020681]|uniref:EXPERA domain-containing protein n=1 Tax=Streptomyces sp. NPDC020681 TaxID=3365083 RepID=UPI0037B5548E
ARWPSVTDNGGIFGPGRLITEPTTNLRLRSLGPELYFILNVHTLPERSDLLAKAFALYGKADAAYAGHGDVSVPLALETINVFITQILNIALGWAIIRRKSFRHPLQLVVSAYVSYSVILYFWLQHISSYRAMEERTVASFLLLYLANLPWLAGYGYLASRSFVAILRRFKSADHPG